MFLKKCTKNCKTRAKLEILKRYNAVSLHSHKNCLEIATRQGIERFLKVFSILLRGLKKSESSDLKQYTFISNTNKNCTK